MLHPYKDDKKSTRQITRVKHTSKRLTIIETVLIQKYVMLLFSTKRPSLCQTSFLSNNQCVERVVTKCGDIWQFFTSQMICSLLPTNVLLYGNYQGTMYSKVGDIFGKKSPNLHTTLSVFHCQWWHDMLCHHSLP